MEFEIDLKLFALNEITKFIYAVEFSDFQNVLHVKNYFRTRVPRVVVEPFFFIANGFP